MRAVAISRQDDDRFDYYCPICGAELDASSYDTFDAEYYCPVCSTQQRPSRVAARVR